MNEKMVFGKGEGAAALRPKKTRGSCRSRGGATPAWRAQEEKA